MPFTSDEMEALRALLAEELHVQLQPIKDEVFRRIYVQLKLFRSEVNEKFDSVQRRFYAVDKRFDGVDKRLDGVDKRFDGVDKRLDGVDKRLDVVETKIAGLMIQQQSLQEQVNQGFAETNKRFDQMANHIDALYQLDENRQQEYLFIREQIKRLEEKTA